MFLATRAAVFILVATSVAVSAKLSFTMRLSGPNTIYNVDTAKVIASVTNTGDELLKLVNTPNSVLSTSPTDTFEIVGDVDGSRPHFAGIIVNFDTKFVAESDAATSLTFLNPGETINVSHDLTRAYDLSVLKKGAYSIQAFDYLTHIGSDGTLIALRSSTPAFHLVSLTNSALLHVNPLSDNTLVSEATYPGCSQSQISDIGSAIAGAISYIQSAYSAILSPSTVAARYVRWFGANDKTRFATVTNNWKILNATGTKPLDYQYTCATASDTGCQGGYAYVYPSMTGKIWLCSPFFGKKVYGPDSSSGTILHEISHFTSTIGTIDAVVNGQVVAGQAANLALARNSPAVAITNANSYRYFAENA